MRGITQLMLIPSKKIMLFAIVRLDGLANVQLLHI
jgi:hypothetical protein